MITRDRAVVISLARRPERLQAFWSRLRDGWPGAHVDVFPAVDGHAEAIPDEWQGTPGAWGCYRSHLAVVEQAIVDGLDRLLVFEDDATFLPGFARRTNCLVPDDCEQLYLGGEHLQPPKPGPMGFVRGVNVNRTHAYWIFGQPAMEKIRDHLQWNPAAWTDKHSVDHHLGLLHERNEINVYAMSPWVCGQAAGESDIDGKTWPDRAWS